MTIAHAYPSHPRGPAHWTGDVLCYCHPIRKGEIIVHHDLTPQEAVLRATERWRYALANR